MKILLLLALLQAKPFGMEINGKVTIIMDRESNLVGYHCQNATGEAVYVSVREGISTLLMLIVAGTPNGTIDVKYPAFKVPSFILRATRLTATASFDQRGTRPAVVRCEFTFDDSSEAEMKRKLLK